jgi:DNA ligase-1
MPEALWRDLAQTMDAVAAASAKRDKTAIVARYLRTLDDDSLRIACTYLSGRVFPAGSPRKVNIGWSAIVSVLGDLVGASDQQLSEAYLRWGDLGDVTAELLERRRTARLSTRPITLRGVHETLLEGAEAEGKGSRGTRARVLRALLEQASPIEGKYLVRVLTGDLRIGLREGLLEDAVAEAFGVAAGPVRRAHLLQSDVGEVAAMARHGTLERASLRYFHPFRFMLANTILTAEEAFTHGGPVLAEDKYDGIRVQVHRLADRLAIYSRTLDDITASFPELSEDLRAVGEAYIADGEVVAWRDDRPLPFHTLQLRLRRRDPGALVSEVPVVVFLFDLLRVADTDLLDLPLTDRRAHLRELRFSPCTRATVADEIADAHTLAARFRAARERGNEGLVVKRLDSPYQPGRRGSMWVKWKEELATLDVVVVAVEHGHGKRAGVLSDYTFAVRDGDNLRVVGKAYSGLTDREIADLTEWFREHTVRDHGRYKVVEPNVVLEVAFDAVTRSDRHESGYALRFPRIKRIRDDKTRDEINSLEDVDAIYRAQRVRAP